MRDVARAANCDQSTVSLALRGDPRISSCTRDRIESVARSLGYSVHPMISAWVSARRSGRRVEARLPLAYIDFDHEVPADSEIEAESAACFEGARERSMRHGYVLTKFCWKDYESNPRRLGQVLSTRGIRGILFGSAAHPICVRGWSWSQFSCIGIGRSMQEPVLHRVVRDDISTARLEDAEAWQRFNRSIGRNAVDWLVQMLTRNHVGAPEERHTLVVEVPQREYCSRGYETESEVQEVSLSAS